MQKGIGTTLTVSNDWLNTDLQSVTNANDDYGNVQAGKLGGYYYANTWYPYITHWAYSYVPKIQLKLSEIDKLRKLAKENPDVKEILNKFTAHIEVVVDF